LGTVAPGRFRHRRAPDYLGEFLNVPVTIVNGAYVGKHVLLVGRLVHEHGAL